MQLYGKCGRGMPFSIIVIASGIIYIAIVFACLRVSSKSKFITTL